MQPELPTPSTTTADKLSPRPSPQHSKSLTAPPDCTNCSKQQANPINNFISKWKYKEDLAKPSNSKRTRPRKQPQTTYHFPLSHCTVNTSNPNKQNEEEEVVDSPAAATTTPETPPSTESQLPRTPPQTNSPEFYQNHSPRHQASREALLRQHLQQYEHQKQTHDIHLTTTMDDDHLKYDYTQLQPQRHRYETSILEKRQSCDHYQVYPRQKKIRLHPHSMGTSIPPICNTTMHDDHPSPSYSPQTSDDDSDHSPFAANSTLRASTKSRSSTFLFARETIEISDNESEFFSYPTFHHSPTSFVSPRLGSSLELPDLSSSDGLSYSRHPLSLTSAHNDLAKYHLETKSQSLPPLNFARLPPIDELPLGYPWPMDDSNPRLRHLESIRLHSRSHSFGSPIM